MIQLNDREWEIFQIDKIFDIYPGKRLTKADMKAGKLPFIGATENNNGITEWIANVNDSLDCKVLGVNYNGSVVETFYHPYSCIFSDDVKRLHLKEKAYDGNRYIMLFIKTTILKQKIKYAYGYKFNENRMKKQFITLPVTDDNKPDWQFMEDYMRQQEITILQPTIEMLRNRLKNSELGGGKIEHLEWREFNFIDVFTDIKRGKRLKTADHTEGEFPYVSSTALCNGVDGFIGNTTGVRMFEDCLTVANSGSVGSSFYHRYQFVASDHVTQLKRNGIDRYAYLFIAPLVNRLSEKYSFNREINDNRIKREKIILPADSKGNPDFAFMSDYMKHKENEILTTALHHFEQKLTA